MILLQLLEVLDSKRNNIDSDLITHLS